MAEIMDAGLDVEKIAEIMNACLHGRIESDTFPQTVVASGFEFAPRVTHIQGKTDNTTRQVNLI